MSQLTHQEFQEFLTSVINTITTATDSSLGIIVDTSLIGGDDLVTLKSSLSVYNCITTSNYIEVRLV